jgi:hypothetical protein
MKLSISRRLLVVVSSLALGGSALAGTASAVEAPVFSDAVAISGCVNVSPAVQLVGGGGSFTGPVTCNPPYNVVPNVCEIVSDPDLPAVEGPFDCLPGLSFSGTYTNIVCGTGSASGTANLPEADETYHITFLVQFVAGQGVFVGDAPTDDGWDIFTGPVDIIPTAPFPPACPITQFRFTTALAAVDSPVPLP